jgi:hypothetical protein
MVASASPAGCRPNDSASFTVAQKKERQAADRGGGDVIRIQ